MRLRAAQPIGGGGAVSGYHLYAFFLNLIHRVNPALSRSLHGEGGPKPFTLAPLGTGSPRRRLTTSAGNRLCFRVTCLDEEVFASLADAVWQLPGDALLSLGDGQVQCQGLLTTPNHSRWAAFSSFPQLWEGSGTAPKLRLNFLSPTTFRSRGRRNTLFPEPSLVFGSLLARWNAYAPTTLRLGADRTATAGLMLTGYRLSTRMLDFGSYQELGFQGQVTYEPAGHVGDEQLHVLNALADFAFYAGVGAKTTMGMGQCRRLSDAGAVPHRARGHPGERRGAVPGNQGGEGAPEDTGG